MTLNILSAIAASLLLQAAADAPAPDAAPVPVITAFDQLPIEEAAAPRCAVAFATVGRWQMVGDPRGADYPDMENDGGREFFVRTMANLMEGRGLSRGDVATILTNEAAALSSDEGAERVAAMMPACLLMKRSAGL